MTPVTARKMQVLRHFLAISTLQSRESVMAVQDKTNLYDFFRRFGERLKTPQTQADQADFEECLIERGAIMEHDGGLPRQEAELQARVICLTEYRTRKGIKA